MTKPFIFISVLSTRYTPIQSTAHARSSALGLFLLDLVHHVPLVGPRPLHILGVAPPRERLAGGVAEDNARICQGLAKLVTRSLARDGLAYLAAARQERHVEVGRHSRGVQPTRRDRETPAEIHHARDRPAMEDREPVRVMGLDWKRELYAARYGRGDAEVLEEARFEAGFMEEGRPDL